MPPPPVGATQPAPCGFFLACRGCVLHKAFTVSERVAIAEAVAERLGKRQGGDRKTDQSGNISTLIDHGKTRDLAAAKAGLGSGKTLEAAMKVMSLLKVCPGATLGSVTNKKTMRAGIFDRMNRNLLRGTLRGMIGQKRKNPK